MLLQDPKRSCLPFLQSFERLRKVRALLLKRPAKRRVILLKPVDNFRTPFLEELSDGRRVDIAQMKEEHRELDSLVGNPEVEFRSVLRSNIDVD